MTSSKPKKLVPGPYSTTWSYISLAYNKNMADEEKYLYAFRRRVYNLHLIQISVRYMHVWQQYSADKIWSWILVPVPGVGPGFYSFPCGRSGWPASPDIGPLVHTVYSVRTTSHIQKNKRGVCPFEPNHWISTWLADSDRNRKLRLCPTDYRKVDLSIQGKWPVYFCFLNSLCMWLASKEQSRILIR